MNNDVIHKGCQSLYDKLGNIVFKGVWDSKELLDTVAKAVPNGDWNGKNVLVMASNTSGFCLELARKGAHVIACEPDPFKNTRALVRELLENFVKEEKLSIDLLDLDFFSSHKLTEGESKIDGDTIIICFGIIYHFRDIIYALEYLGSLPHSQLLISTQTHPSESYVLYNRIDPEIIKIPKFWDNHNDTISGWHFSRKMFEEYLKSVGYTDVTPLTPPSFDFPNKPKGHTNSAYYSAMHIRQNNFKSRIEEYLPR